MRSLLLASVQFLNIFTTTPTAPSIDPSPSFPSNSNNSLFYGADYNPEQWPRATWDEDVKLMRQAGVNVVSVGIFSWALLEPSEDHWDFGWLDDILDLLHDNGISVDLGTATTSPPPWLTKLHPEILPVTDKGETLWPGGRQHWRATSPIFRKYALRLVRKLAKRYGKHPAVIAWHVNNELGAHNSLDYSDDAAVAFREWLKERYTTIEALNYAWGTAFWSQHYGNFDEILPPRLATTFINPTQQLDFRRFSSDVLRDHLVAEQDILHKWSPGRPVTTNFMVMQGGKSSDYASWSDSVDFVANDHYRFPDDPYERDELSFSASLTSGLSKGKPWWLMEHSTSAVNWHGVNPPKRKGELARDSLTHVAHGADAVCFFQWRQSKSGGEKFHSAMIPHAGPNSRLFKDVVELGQMIHHLSAIKGSHRAPAKIAILFDWEAMWASEQDSHPSSLVNYYHEALRWFVAFLDYGVRVDILPTRNVDLSAYELVVAPVLYLVDEPLLTTIQTFVETGGHFVTTYFSGIADKNDHIRLGGYPGAFKDILGINVEEFSPLMDGHAITLENGAKGDVWSEQIDIVGENVTVLEKYADGDLHGLPAVTRNVAGKGSATYVSTRLDIDGIGKILPHIVPLHLRTELPEELRGSVEHTVRTDGKVEWTFLINRTDRTLKLGGVQGDLLLSTGGGDGELAPNGLVVLSRALEEKS